jgi:Mg2+/Co2+ transporter CorB
MCLNKAWKSTEQALGNLADNMINAIVDKENKLVFQVVVKRRNMMLMNRDQPSRCVDQLMKMTWVIIWDDGSSRGNLAIM